MGQNINGQVSTIFALQEQIATGVLQTINYPLPITNTVNYPTAAGGGTAAGQLDTIYAAQLTLAGTTIALNLHTGLIDPAGNAISFARVREFVVQVVTATAGYSVEVYAGASDGWPFLPPVANPLTAQPNGGMVILRDSQSSGSGVGNVVTATTGNIVLNPGSNTVVVNVIIAGCSAP
jgi:hypothetical protein